MNAMTWIRLVLRVAFAALFNACQAPGAPGDTPAGPPGERPGLRVTAACAASEPG
jgi:hypothetical protein